MNMYTTKKWPYGIILSASESKIIELIKESNVSLQVVDRPDIQEILKKMNVDKDMTVAVEDGKLMGQKDISFRGMGINLPRQKKNGMITLLGGSTMKLFLKR